MYTCLVNSSETPNSSPLYGILFGKVSIKQPLSYDAACFLSLSLIVKVPIINHSLVCNTKKKKKKT